jgi:hypothetical protein
MKTLNACFCLFLTLSTSCANRNIDERIPRDLDETTLKKYIVDLGSDNPLIRDRAYLVLSEQNQLTSRKTIKEATLDSNPNIRLMADIILSEKDNFIRRCWLEKTQMKVSMEWDDENVTLHDFIGVLCAFTFTSILFDLDVDQTLICKVKMKDTRLCDIIRAVLEPHGLICTVNEGRVTVMKSK